jgi:glutaminyl-peptide cyclotransferase
MPRLATISIVVLAVFLALGVFRVYRTGAESVEPVLQEKRERDAFAQDREPAPQAAAVAFDGGRAMTYLKQICKLGPRMSGTEAMKKQIDMVKKHFEDLGGKVELQNFSSRQVGQKQPVDMTNVIVRWFPDRTRRVILCSHYDTRPIADQEDDERKWHEPFISANDGGSGVAFLMEMAHHMKDLKTEVGVDFVLFDGEEYIFQPKRDKYFFGSEHFAKRYKQDRPNYKYIGAVLLDMIAGKTAHFPAEQHSYNMAQSLVEDLWRIAEDQKSRFFLNRLGQSVQDDHLALISAGIPAVDLIDFDYPHWHRLTDTPENCSADPMIDICKVLTVWMQKIK